MDIRCDECHERINTESVKIVDKWIGDGVRRKFFRCPKCGCEYTIAYTDGKIRELSKKYKKLENKFKILVRKNGKHDCIEANKVNRKMKEIMRTMDNMSKRLQMRYENNV